MELNKALITALEGNAILFAGSGFSFGALNLRDKSIHTGTELRDYLGEESGLKKSDYQNYNLADVTDYYIFKNDGDTEKLIKILKELFTVKKTQPHHDKILSVPWKRIYTTNYDDVIEFAGKNNNKKIRTVTLSDDEDTESKIDICVHLNGFVEKLTAETLNDEFKLTDSSYNAASLEGKFWFRFMVNDFMVAKSIIIIGYSMSADLDITRVLSLPQISKKIIFIDKKINNPIAKQKFTRYANVEEIGIEGFAEALEEAKKNFVPSAWDDKHKEFICFKHEYMNPLQPVKIHYENYINFYFWGNFNREFFQKSSSGDYFSVVNRTAVNKFFNAWNSFKIFLITSSLGNGKTIFCEILKNELRSRDCHVFTLCQYNEDDISKEIELICQHYKHSVVVMDDCYKNLDLLKHFQMYGRKDITFVLTTRLSIANLTQKKIADIFNVKETEIFRLSLQSLDRDECRQLEYIFSNEKILSSKLSSKNYNKLDDYFFYKCDGSFANILLDLFESSHIKDKLNNFFNEVISSEKKSLRKLLIAGLCNSVWKLGLTTDDIFYFLKINVLSYQSDSTFNELFNVSKGEFLVNSSIIARSMIYNIISVKNIVEMLMDIVPSIESFCHEKLRYQETLKAIVSHSNFFKFTRNDNGASEIKKFYDSLRNLSFFKDNPFYWEEFAAACIDAKDFPTAKQCIVNAYACGKKIPNFIPFQISTVEADYFLEYTLQSNLSHYDITENMKKSSELLMKHYDHPSNNHSYVFSVAKKFLKIFDINQLDFDKRDLSVYVQIAGKIQTKLHLYMKKSIAANERDLWEFHNRLAKSVNEAKSLVAKK